MGILGLVAQLKESLAYVIRVNPETLNNKTLGVDAFVWLHRVVSKCSDNENYCRLFHSEPQVPFYELLYRYLDDELRL